MKTFKPVTPSLRFRVQINFKKLLTHTGIAYGTAFFKCKKPLKYLTKGSLKKGGRNCFGRLTAFRKGGGHKQKYRLLSYSKTTGMLPYSIIQSVEYDPFRSSFISCCFLKETGNFQYILSSQNVEIGSLLISNYGLRRPNDGSTCILFYSNIGDFLYNINLNNGPLKYTVASAGGTFCKVIKKEIASFYAIIQIPSGKFRRISLSSLGFLGKASNPSYKFSILGKAGRSRWLGKRPTVRGVAMNPVDHPHGGGEGKSSGGRPSCTPWGFPTKGKPTARANRKKLYIL